MSEELCRENPSIMVFCGSPLIRVSFVATDQWASPKRRIWKTFPDTILCSSLAKIKAKFENQIGHRFKNTQPNLMILVSSSSAEDALSNNVNKYNILARKVLKIRRSAFLGHPV